MTKCTPEEIQELIGLYEDALADDFSVLSQLYKSRREFEEMMMEAIQEHMEALEEELITLLFKGRKAYKELKAQRERERELMQLVQCFS